MFYLHTSNRTENLLQHLAAVIRADARRDIFEKEYILIQSQGMERMISQYLADTFTSWCNFHYLLPLSFLQSIAEKLGMEILPDGFDRRFLCWRIVDQLHRLDTAAFAPLRRYLEGEDVDLKRYQLARQLANIFDQYQVMRPLMLDNWEKGILCTGSEAEIWQMQLWNRLTADTSLGEHRGKLLQRVIVRLMKEKLDDVLPQRISVFGLHIMPPIFLDYLNGISRHCDVHLFLLSPCRHYWGDFRRRLSPLPAVIDTAGEESAADHQPAAPHPLLVSLGMQGRLFQDMILEKVLLEREISSYEDPLVDSAPLLLHRLQSDILAGVVEEKISAGEEDDSVQIVSCHSRLRELAILRDTLLDFLSNDPNLELRDIVVMAPDIQEYAASIPAFFEEIQHSIADRSLRRSNIYISVFQEFLVLLSGRFGWTEVLALLQKEQIYPQFLLHGDDFDLLQHWVMGAGVRWGLSGESRRAKGFDFSENSWRSGLQRLLMGYLTSSEQSIKGVLPYVDIEGGEAAILGGLCEFLSVVESAQRSFSSRHSLKEWARLMLAYVEKLFGKEGEKELLELRNLIAELDQCGDVHEHPTDFRVVSAWFQSSASESRSVSGFLKGHITFCSMLPMRSIPFKVVCMIGMNYGAFPKNDRHSTFDLMRLHPQAGDRSQRADDRYQFLEALLSARKNLYISYVGQSLQNNETIPPSVVVTELLETLSNDYRLTDRVVKHPLHPFSSRYFTDRHPRLFSYSGENCEIAESLSGGGETPSCWWQEKIETEVARIDIGDLLKFYRTPQLFFVENVLGVRVGGDRDLPENTEQFGLTGLDSFRIRHHILTKVLEHEDVAGLQQILCEEGRWPLGTPGNLAFSRMQEDVTRFAETVAAQGMGEKLAGRDIDITVGKFHLVGRLANIHENGILLAKYSAIKGKDLLAGWLHHLLAISSGVTQPCTTMVMSDRIVHFHLHQDLLPGLEALLLHYEEGCCRPSKLYIEPATAYCTRIADQKPASIALDAAERLFRDRIEKGYEPAWALLHRNAGKEATLDQSFVDLCEQIMMPLWSFLHGK